MAKLNLKYYKGDDKYSDGDIEDIILDIVKKKEDYMEILKNTTNWTIFYHLSPLRHNLLNWYYFKEDANLLEIGAGCGALTTLFVKKVKEVTAIELSKKRAEIMFNRCKNYNNLEIIVGNFEDIEINGKYDYITLIGVLEYSKKFINNNNPFENFLKEIKKFLKKEGKVLIAIENKFGLKYWAGAPEDHTGKFFDSLEDYSEDKGIKTFSKIELEELIKKAGYNNIFFYYPIPDYKFPFSIFSDKYLPRLDTEFLVYSPNFDRERLFLFNEALVYKNIIANNQFPFFSNSFLVEVGI